MINGEGSLETSPEAALPGSNSEKSYNGNDSPVPSQYSSCGESDFERYCSANSVMGTPSVCGSVGTFQECADSDFGSVKSFGLSDVGSLESFSLGSVFIRKLGERKMSSPDGSVSLFDDKAATSEGTSSSDVRNDIARQGSVGVSWRCNPHTLRDSSSKYESDHPGVFEKLFPMIESKCTLPVPLDLRTFSNKEVHPIHDGGGIVQCSDHSESVVSNCSQRVSSKQATYVEANMETTSSLGFNSDPYNLAPVETQAQSQVNIRPSYSCLDELHTHTDEEADRREGVNCSDEDKASSRFEYSEDEDSMFGGGTDDEEKIGTCHLQNTHYHQKTRGEKENSFLLSSSTAFGSDDWDDWECNMTSVPQKVEPENLFLSSPVKTDTVFSGNGSKQGGMAIETPLDSNQLQGAYELGQCSGHASLSPVDSLDLFETELGEDAHNIFGTTNHMGYLGKLEDHKLYFDRELPPLAVSNGGLDPMGNHLRIDCPALSTQNIINEDSERIESEKSRLRFDSPSDLRTSQISSTSIIAPQNQMVYLHGEQGSSSNEKSIERRRNSHASLTPHEEHAEAVTVENLELHGFYNEVVQEMEEILLDSTESPGTRFNQADAANQFHLHLPLRDGGSTASTSGDADAYEVSHRSLTVDRIEVVGAKQKTGDVSFGERLVGVKKYTVYVIRVWSGKDIWEVERRYRDFCTLHRRLKTLFADKGWVLPSHWSMVEKESRKIFGSASPNVVAERSTLIQECLQSLLLSRFSSSLPNALIWFLGPSKFCTSSPASDTHNPQHPLSLRHSDDIWNFGQTVSLIVELRPYKSTKQILEAQQYTCAGCHKHFDDGKTRMLEFVQTLGWGKPRLCEYSGQLFCSSCHMSETAVLPARVLHHWDFTQYPVSQLAKSYLDSIYDQPMLCVSAVNPFLFSKVPALLQVLNVRKRIGTMLPFVRCPFRMSIYKGLASRRYLLESNDFFALRDLIDLSKGAFAALPTVIDAVSTRITEHITEQCLVCCDVGVPCNARQACNDPSSLIFPFQDGEIDRCRSCKSVFHKHCFKKIGRCPCLEPLNQGREWDGSGATSQEEVYGGQSSGGSWDMFWRSSETKSTIGFLSGLFTKARQEGPSSPIQGHNVILMGSLPSTSL